MIPVDQQADRRSCRGCGTHVSADFARTFGDAEDVVHRCLECDTFGRVAAGSAAGRELPTRQDPQTTPGRQVDAVIPLADGGDAE